MGVLRRRHLLTRHGREVIGLDDEVFDPEAVEAAGLTVLGEGALLAALERNRTGRMADIVATIQAEQDAAVRADLPGRRSIVAGGPGTGKTAVALHRAAYLLYTFRRRLGEPGRAARRAEPVFLRYIEQVLPSLGEHEVQLATVAGLKPQLGARAASTTARGRGGQGRRAAWRRCCAARSTTASGRRARTSRSASTGCGSGLRAASAVASLERVKRRRGHAQRAPAARRAHAARPARRAVPRRRWPARTARCSTSTYLDSTRRATTRRSRRALRSRRAAAARVGARAHAAACAATPRCASCSSACGRS